MSAEKIEQLKVLSDRLSKLIDPSREVDGEFWKAILSDSADGEVVVAANGEKIWHRRDDDGSLVPPPPYTSNVRLGIYLVSRESGKSSWNIGAFEQYDDETISECGYERDYFCEVGAISINQYGDAKQLEAPRLEAAVMMAKLEFIIRRLALESTNDAAPSGPL